MGTKKGEVNDKFSKHDEDCAIVRTQLGIKVFRKLNKIERKKDCNLNGLISCAFLSLTMNNLIFI